MLNEKEIFEYLSSRLTIRLNSRTDFGPIHKIEATLYLEDENGTQHEISSDSVSLDNPWGDN